MEAIFKLLFVKKFIEFLTVSLNEKSWVHHREENTSTGPNKFSKQYHSAPEFLYSLQRLLHLAVEKNGSDSWDVWADLPVLLLLVAFHLPQTMLWH